MKRIDWCLPMLLLLMPFQAGALQRLDTAGLALTIDEIPEPLQLDGMPVRITRVRGRDVPALVERIAVRWRASGLPLLPLTHEGWSMLSHWEGQRSQLLQWRGTGESAELLWSSLDVAKARPSPAAAPIPVPMGCSWSGELRIPGPQGALLLGSARCEGNRNAAHAWLIEALKSDGWELASVGADLLRLSRSGTAATLVSGDDVSRPGYWLVWTEERPAVGSDR